MDEAHWCVLHRFNFLETALMHIDIDWSLAGSMILAVLNSPAGYTALSGVLIYVYKRLGQHFQWDTERWDNLIHDAFNIAEGAGITDAKLGSMGKLGVAIERFKNQHMATYGHAASTKDLADATNDLAKLARDQKWMEIVKRDSAPANPA